MAMDNQVVDGNFTERRAFVIIVRITMKALIEKRTEMMQTLLSMIEPVSGSIRRILPAMLRMSCARKEPESCSGGRQTGVLIASG